jgi:predicted nucleic acid-binding protein
VTRCLLDTNIISNATKALPSEMLTEWMAKQADDDLFISSFNLAEIYRWILEKPSRKKRRELEAWFQSSEGPQALFQGRVLAFDERAALIWARLMSQGTVERHPRSGFDMVVAAIAVANDCIVVTDNEKHFSGLRLLNPLRGVPDPEIG